MRAQTGFLRITNICVFLPIHEGKGRSNETGKAGIFMDGKLKWFALGCQGYERGARGGGLLGRTTTRQRGGYFFCIQITASGLKPVIQDVGKIATAVAVEILLPRL